MSIDPPALRTTPTVPADRSIVAAATRIADEVAAAHAAAVDRDARFPAETFDALRRGRLLSALVPIELGGAGADLATVARAATAIGRRCGSSALVFAMHHSQVASLVGHSEDTAVRETLRAVADGELLVASATTETAVGGDTRKSRCHVERDGSRFRLTKQAPVISYGEHADLVLATARRNADSPPNDQVLVVCRREGLNLAATGGWDTLGFRGTCSKGYLLHAEGPADAVLDTPFAQISTRTMTPVSHMLWTAAWLGLAEEAVDRAHRAVRATSPSPASPSPGALRLARTVLLLHQLRALLDSALRHWAELSGHDSALARPAAVIEFNSLKVSASTLLLEIATEAMAVCGIAGYRADGPHSIARILRDAHGASIMINNDRIDGNSAGLLLIAKTL